MTDKLPRAEIWDCSERESSGRGIYVAISGNTAAGKSSLIEQLELRLRHAGVDAIGISERAFHHQYLRLMFSEPVDFAFPIQLSFMLNRHMVLLRHFVELRRVVIMERSHLDDSIFVNEHVESGSIAADQAVAYSSVSSVLSARLPLPDVLVLMNPSPELSIIRLKKAEELGDRPAEFPSEEAKEGWVHRWYELYLRLHEYYRQQHLAGGVLADTTLVVVDPTAPTSVSSERVYQAVQARLRLVRGMAFE